MMMLKIIHVPYRHDKTFCCLFLQIISMKFLVWTLQCFVLPYFCHPYHCFKSYKLQLKRLRVVKLHSLDDRDRDKTNCVTVDVRCSSSNDFLPNLKGVKYSTLKLPVWPVWAGVMATCAELLNIPKLCQNIVEVFGGRVVPMTLTSDQMPLPYDTALSPFLLLAHHSHSFTPLDPVRAITKLILPEGFPAHPHAGFDTVTYCISGGLKHRDSEGFKMSYGDGDVQWMRSGNGVIHEEMWDLDGCDWKHKGIELFQLWVNLPAAAKDDSSSTHLIRASDIKVLEDSATHTVVRVIAGEAALVSNNGTSISSATGPGNSIAASPLHILHVTVPPRSTSRDLLLSVGEEFLSVFVYVRRGSLIIRKAKKNSDDGQPQLLVEEDEEEEVHAFDSVVYTPTTTGSSGSSSGSSSLRNSLSLRPGSDGFDGLVLVGKPLRERVLWRGPYVQSDEGSLIRSARIFESIGNSAFWDHTIGDSQWLEHCSKLELQKKINAFMSFTKNEQ